MRNSIKLIVKLLKRGGKEVTFFVIIAAITSALLFNLMNIVNNPILLDLDKGIYIGIASNLLFIIAISFFILANANAYLVKVKGSEIGIEVLSGVSSLKLGMLLTIQNTILNLIGYIIGIAIGYMMLPILNLLVFGEISFSLYPQTLGNIIVVLFLEAIALGIINQGFGYRNDIKALLGIGEASNFTQERYKKTLTILNYFCFILIGGAVLLFAIPPSVVKSMSDSIVLLIYIPILGGLSFYRTFLPRYLEKKKGMSLNDKFKPIVYSNLKVSLGKNKISYAILLILSGAFPTIFFLLKGGNEAFDKVVTAFAITAVIMIICMIIFNVVSSNIDEIKALMQLRVLGYSDGDIIKIMRYKISGLFLSLAIMPIYIQIVYVVYLVTKMGLGIISGATFILGYIFIFFIGCLITYHMSLKALKEKLEI